MANANRATLALVALLLLLFCLPWGAIALYGVLGAFPYETAGTCYSGRPLWAIGQLVVAIAGIALTLLPQFVLPPGTLASPVPSSRTIYAVIRSADEQRPSTRALLAAIRDQLPTP